jgi:broad specificity phosphatase PhoE
MNFIEISFPGGESFREVVGRVESFISDLEVDAGPVLVIAHRACWYALEHLLKGRDLTEILGSPWHWQPGWEYRFQGQDLPRTH